MTDRHILYKLKPGVQNEKIADALDIELESLSQSNVQAKLEEDDENINTLQRTAFNSGRSFIRFNDGFTIDDTNLATFEGKNIIYTAKNDKPTDSPTRPDVNLPNDAQIAEAGESYPIVFEFTHLGGTAVFQDTNLVRLFVDGEELTRLVRDQSSVVIKPGIGVDYEFTSAVFDPNDTILPTGVFNLKTDSEITSIATIATELSGVTIVAGDAYLIETGGTWSGLTVPDNSILVAIVNSASLSDSVNNNDWLLLDNPRVNAKSSAFLANWVQDGIRFNSNRNVQIHPDNVVVFESMGSGLPIERTLAGNTQGARSIRYDNVPIQLSDIVGGRLTLGLNINIESVSGFSPVFERIEIRFPDFDGVVFDFPLTNAPQNGSFSSTIDIPSIDYSGAINSNASVIFYYSFAGQSFFGSYTLTSLINTSKGRLHDAILQLSNTSVAEAEMRLGTRIDEVIGTVNEENSSIESLVPRVSPYRNNPISSPDVTARYLDSTGSDSFPSTLNLLSEVSPDNPRFTGGNVALYVAVIAGDSHVLNNITQDVSIPLSDDHAQVSLGESLNENGQTYFVYQVIGLTSTDVYEIDRTILERVVAWDDDISILKSDIERIDTELEHAVLNLPDALINVLDNEVTVTEEDTPSVSASDYNKSFTPNQSQAIFLDVNAPVNSLVNSSAINVNIANDQYRNKLMYIPQGTTVGNQVILSAFDGTTSVPLITYADGRFTAKKFIPLIPAGTSVSTQYASENNGEGSGAFNPIDIVPGTRDANGNIVPENVSLSITRNLPTSNESITVSIDGVVNGNDEGIRTFTLPFNGDANLTYIEAGGFNTGVNFRARYSNGIILLEVTNQSNNFAIDLSHFKVLLSYQRVQTVPATPATVRDIPLSTESLNTANVFAFKDVGGNLVVESDAAIVDTGYAYTTLFSANESGTLQTPLLNGVFMDYRVFAPSTVFVQQLENHSTLPQFGLFTTNYTHETIVNLGTGLRVSGLFGVAKLTVAQRNSLAAENGDIIYNVDDKEFNFFEDDAWHSKVSNP